MDIELETKDYVRRSGTSVKDLFAAGRPGMPCNVFGDRASVSVGGDHIVLCHEEWNVRLLCGPKVKSEYEAARPTFFDSEQKFLPKKLVRFVERQIARELARNPRNIEFLIKRTLTRGIDSGKREARATMREALGMRE